MRPMDHESAHRRTDRCTDENWFYNLFRAICYSYGADNKKLQKVAYIGEHVEKLLASKVGVVQTLLTFDLLVRSGIAHQNAELLCRQANRYIHQVSTKSRTTFPLFNSIYIN